MTSWPAGRPLPRERRPRPWQPVSSHWHQAADQGHFVFFLDCQQCGHFWRCGLQDAGVLQGLPTAAGVHRAAQRSRSGAAQGSEKSHAGGAAPLQQLGWCVACQCAGCKGVLLMSTHRVGTADVCPVTSHLTQKHIIQCCAGALCDSGIELRWGSSTVLAGRTL